MRLPWRRIWHDLTTPRFAVRAEEAARREMARELLDFLVGHMYSVPVERRRLSRWVMNDEWLEECKKIGWEPPACPTHMLGLPVMITADGGFPHLEARP